MCADKLEVSSVLLGSSKKNVPKKSAKQSRHRFVSDRCCHANVSRQQGNGKSKVKLRTVFKWNSTVRL